MKNVGNSSRGRSQGVPKIFRAPMYRAHCAVIFAIAQLSCIIGYYQNMYKWWDFLLLMHYFKWNQQIVVICPKYNYKNVKNSRDYLGVGDTAYS